MASQTSLAMSSKVSPQEPSPSTVPPQVQTISIRAPKNLKKKYSVMRFNGGLNVDFEDWKQAKMQRENNVKGAGSEFGRAAREEATRKKYGINTRKYKSENQPWILKTNGKSGKKFKGVKVGGINENAAYYIFSPAADGAIEAYPLHEWCNFQMIQRYKTLSAEEAEDIFSRRDKVMNYFSLMMKKRLRNDEKDAEDAELVEAAKGKRSNKKMEKDFKISEMDEWIDSDDDSDDSDSYDKENRKKSSDEDDDSKKKKKGKDLKKKKKDYDDEAFEESDDGDEEGRELDYISDSSASESELEQQKEMKSVAEESGLRQLLDSDDEDETEENKDKKSENGVEEGKEKDDKRKEKSGKTNDKEKSKKKSTQKEKSENGVEEGKEKDDKRKEKSGKTNDKEKSKKKGTQKESSDSSDRETISEKNKNQAGPSRKRTPDSPIDTPQTKKFKTENNYSSSSYIPGASESGITADAVRRYLMRRPMTTTELLHKFKAKKTGLSSEKIVIIMTKILQTLNPISQKIKGKTYFSIEKGS